MSAFHRLGRFLSVGHEPVRIGLNFFCSSSLLVLLENKVVLDSSEIEQGFLLVLELGRLIWLKLLGLLVESWKVRLGPLKTLTL